METEKLYSPLNFYLRDQDAALGGRYNDIDYWRDPLTHEEAFNHLDSIDSAIHREMEGIDPKRGLAEYVPDSLDDIILSLHPAVELHGESLWCVANITLARPITPGEMGELTQWWTGQLSDGWGEGLEQRWINVRSGELYIEPWTPDDKFFIATQEKFEQRIGISPPQAETPAQAALHEPDIYDDEGTAALRKQLVERLDRNLHEYFDALGADTVHDIANMTSEIANVAGAHYYLSEIHNFHASELEYLLQFQDPLSVVANAFEMSGMDDHSDIMWEIFDRQDALQGDYPLMPDPAGEAARKRELFHRLDSNLSDYCEGLMSVDKTEIIGMANEIAAQYSARDYLKNSYDFQPGEVDYLLQFKHPLAVVANQWPVTLDGLVPLDDAVHDILSDREAHTDYLLATARTEPAAQIQQAGKPSVIEQIRQAREEMKDKPAPHRNSPGKGREPEL